MSNSSRKRKNVLDGGLHKCSPILFRQGRRSIDRFSFALCRRVRIIAAASIPVASLRLLLRSTKDTQNELSTDHTQRYIKKTRAAVLGSTAVRSPQPRNAVTREGEGEGSARWIVATANCLALSRTGPNASAVPTIACILRSYDFPVALWWWGYLTSLDTLLHHFLASKTSKDLAGISRST